MSTTMSGKANHEGEMEVTDMIQPIADLVGRLPVGVSPSIASRCASCSGQMYPAGAVCIRCGGIETEIVDLPREGLLYSFTTVRISRDRTAPYILGYVDLPGDVRVLVRLSGDDLAIGAVVAASEDGTWKVVGRKRGQGS